MMLTVLKIYFRKNTLCATMKFVEHKQKLLKVFIVTYLICESHW